MVIGHHIAVFRKKKARTGDGGLDGLTADDGGAVAGDAHHGGHIPGIDLGGGQNLTGRQRRIGCGGAPVQLVQPGLQGPELRFQGFQLPLPVSRT